MKCRRQRHNTMSIIDFVLGGILIFFLVGFFAAYAFYSGEARTQEAEARSSRISEKSQL